MTITIAISILIIGATLGLTGAGGSILAVPLLLYLGDLPLKEAIAISFFVIASSSMVALLFHIRNRAVDWKLAFVFGIPAMIGAFFGGLNAQYFPDSMILGIFYSLMLISGFKLASSKENEQEFIESQWVISKYLLLSLSGLILGLVTGLIGVGGGFLVVPALLILVRIRTTTAVGTSLCIVVGQASFGLVGYAQHTAFDLKYAAILAVLCSLGSLAGARLSVYIESSIFKLVFGWFLLLFAAIFGTVELIKGLGHHLHGISTIIWIVIFVVELNVIIVTYYLFKKSRARNDQQM
jgi:uncharacterized protein